MEFAELLQIVDAEPTFETGLLLAGKVNPKEVRKQLSRWAASRKILQLRRGMYTLASPYQKVAVHPFFLANRLLPNAYISLQSALAYYGMIPEMVPLTTSVTTGRPQRFDTPLGGFDFRHIRVSWFCGYQQLNFGENQPAFIALPEKALLDLIYLHPGGDDPRYLRSLRLQALEQVDLIRLRELVQISKKPKLARAAQIIEALIAEEKTGYQTL